LQTASSQAYQRLIDLLKELFEFDKSELDFGIYRIMNQKREEISRFLEHDLLPDVRAALDEYGGAERTDLQDQLIKLEHRLREAGVEYEASMQHRELRSRLASADQTAVEEEVYSDLYRFFRRYYKDGDFLSLRRYKEGAYAIPYEGEEVLLHWANRDQYYVKSSENFQDYRFRLPDSRYVHLRIAAASTERDNNKSAPDQERRFLLRSEDPTQQTDGELSIFFEYRPSTDKQADLNARAISALLRLPALSGWRSALSTPCPTQAKAERTLLEKHLGDYTARNSFDYFVHKDLGGFLRRELDFFLKNEVLRVDDLDVDDSARVVPYLARLRAIKRIGRKIIELLAQVEDFQKRLWLKKKFVVETGYCVTLDRVPEVLYPEIAANVAQRQEWVRLFEIDQAQGDLGNPSYSEQLTDEFLRTHPLLALDTKYFGQAFADRLLESFENIDATFSGLLVNGESYQALNLLSARFRNQVQNIYIDPPFNLGANADFLYKTDYHDSSWSSLLEGRISFSRQLMKEDCLYFVRCDYHGSHLVRNLLEQMNLVFKAEILIDRSRNEAGSANKMEATYEHLFMFSREDIPVKKYTVPRSIANIKWTGFLMAGDRNPPERTFLGKTLQPPSGQHYSLRQDKVDKLLTEFYLRLRCRSCGSIYFQSSSDSELERRMKNSSERFKFYDIKRQVESSTESRD
jgi:adenine-specific DNA-methyltransferase